MLKQKKDYHFHDLIVFFLFYSYFRYGSVIIYRSK